MLSNAKHWPEMVHTLPCIDATILRFLLAGLPMCDTIQQMRQQECWLFSPVSPRYDAPADIQHSQSRLLTPRDESAPTSVLSITCNREPIASVSGTAKDSSDRVDSNRPMRTILACGQCLKALVVTSSS